MNPIRYPDWVSLDGANYIGDFFRIVIGDEIFLGKDWLNHITNNPQLFADEIYILAHDDGYDEDGMRWYEGVIIDFYVNDNYDAIFSNDWEDFQPGAWLNPHGYFNAY